MKRYTILIFFLLLFVPPRVFAQDAPPAVPTLHPIIPAVVQDLAVGINALDAITKRISSRMNKMIFSDVQSSIVGSQFERMVKELTDVKKDVNALNEDIETFRSTIPQPAKYTQFKKSISGVYQSTLSILASQKRLIAELKQIQSASSSASPSSAIIPLSGTVAPTIKP